MASRKIVIIDCLDGRLGDYCYERMAGYFVPEFEPVRIEAMTGAAPAGAAGWARRIDAAGMVIGGSQYSPLDPEPWIPVAEHFVAEFFDTGLPTLGICFGHELLCSALGGKLTHRGELAVALRRVRLRGDDPLFAGLGGETAQPVCHEVMASETPRGFVTIGESDDCPIQVMRHETLPVWGVQFHPEMDAEIKVHDSDWIGLGDEEFAKSEGPAVMRNFFEILKKTSA